MRPNVELLDPGFLVASMGSTVLRHQIKGYISGAEGLANNIARTDIDDLIIPLPPLSNQIEIMKFLAYETNQTALLADTLATSIALLRERRSALVTAAVTGELSIEEMSA